VPTGGRDAYVGVVPGKRYASLFALPSFAFPIVLLSMMFMWMYHFGHELSPAAPVTVAPFTRTLVGHGQIGNFHTLGLPGPGFHMILGAAVSVAVAFLLRKKVCGGCAYKDACGVICPYLLLGKAAQEQATDHSGLRHDPRASPVPPAIAHATLSVGDKSGLGSGLQSPSIDHSVLKRP
jgi:hypothetical protein